MYFVHNPFFCVGQVSYLSMWWESADEGMREKLRRLVQSGRLEMTTGGWIMTDEAVVDLYSMVEQLVEGHTFLRRVLDVRPQTSWSVDSFG
jgi:alpha-mannosidase